MQKAMLTAITALAALGGCNSAPPAADGKAIEHQLRDNEAKWNQAYASHDAETLAAAYADDAALANPGSDLVTGRTAIRKETAAFAADPNLKVQFAADRIQVAQSGDLAYTRGHYDLTMTNPETRKPESSKGSYLTIWQKQADGSWKAVEDFITPGRAAAAAK